MKDAGTKVFVWTGEEVVEVKRSFLFDAVPDENYIYGD
jgi:hypothetical protein